MDIENFFKETLGAQMNVGDLLLEVAAGNRWCGIYDRDSDMRVLAIGSILPGRPPRTAGRGFRRAAALGTGEFTAVAVELEPHERLRNIAAPDAQAHSRSISALTLAVIEHESPFQCKDIEITIESAQSETKCERLTIYGST